MSPKPISVHLPKDPEKEQVLLKEVQSMLEKNAIEIVENTGRGFYSHLFVRKKKTGGLRPVIDLKRLDQHLSTPHFKMETAQSICQQLNPFNWVVSIDIKDACFHVPVHKSFRKYLRFVIKGIVYQFIAMCLTLPQLP